MNNAAKVLDSDEAKNIVEQLNKKLHYEQSSN
jgi:hypothetical protein